MLPMNMTTKTTKINPSCSHQVTEKPHLIMFSEILTAENKQFVVPGLFRSGRYPDVLEDAGLLRPQLQAVSKK